MAMPHSPALRDIVTEMGEVFIYWDNSNIFISAKETAVDREGEDARSRVRIHFRNLLDLARAGRSVHHAVAVGSVPPELRHVWNRLENEGVEVRLLERGAMHGREEGVDQILQTCMLRDLSDYNGNPGVAVLLTGDGSGFEGGAGFHADLARMHRKGWGIEVLSWRHSCNRRMREWAVENGTFVALDDFYESVTFTEAAGPGQPIADVRYVKPLDLAARVLSTPRQPGA